MKTPQEYINNNLHFLEEGVNTVDLLNLIEEVQKDSWNEAIIEAANSVRLSLNGSNTPYGEHDCKQGCWTVNKGFILELLKP